MNVKLAGARLVNNHFHALTHRNYRYFWMGQCVSLVGTWMQNIGQAWLVLTLTGSPFLLGLIGTIQFLPFTCLSLFAGVVIDKFPKKRILLVTQSMSMLLALTLSALVFTDTVRYGYVMVLALLLGLTNTFDMPTRQAINIEIVGKDDLMNAIALNSMTFNLARILGPAIGATMMALLGPAWCFLLNGLSFIAVIYGLLQIEAVPYVREKKQNIGVWNEIKDGLVYIRGDQVLLQTLMMVTVVGTLAYNFAVLIPVFTKDVLMMKEQMYGLLMSCLGVGSFGGALAMSFMSKKGPRRKLILISSVLLSVFLLLIGLTHSPLIAGLCLAVTGVFNILFATNSNSTLQIHAKDEYRARVMSIYSLVFAGSTPIGNFFAGYAADRYGASGAFMLCGGICLTLCLGIIWMFRRKASSVTPGEALQQK
ncbi:MFS transporter [Paenibacillus validus]|uniref:MFS transporter n=1 Tax=Paenibacillus validus TaxID=44253 RepID=UPI001FCFD399|nr:MFS transporter [Paenibacillus validus]MED4602062.1 MFS transporter [Paenibacillus validus]MED4607574.1 MFS transporter [Paenibacillus validus]